jgi:hypothetical protein
MSPPPKLSRRTLTFGAVAAAGVAAVAGAVYEVPRLIRHRARGEHADLVDRLGDLEQAAIVGRAIHLDAGEESAAGDLKKRLSKRTLQQLAAEDSLELHRMVEADGWVLPLAVAELCVLAAQAI